MIIFSHLILNFVLLHCYLCVINKILAKEFLYGIIMEQLRLFRAVLKLRGTKCSKERHKSLLFIHECSENRSKFIPLSRRVGGIQCSLVGD